MKIETEFLDEYTNKIDKLLNHGNNQRIYIYNNQILSVCIDSIPGGHTDMRPVLLHSV